MSVKRSTLTDSGWSHLGVVARTGSVFLPAAAIGTVGHELGHWVSSHLLGCAPVLHFASVSPHCPLDAPPEVELLGVAAGPLSTIVCGTAGMVGLARWQKTAQGLDFKGIGWTVLALFWSRPLFNLIVQLGSVALGLVGPQRLEGGDEARLSMAMGWHPLALSIAFAAMSLGVVVWTAFQIPQRLRGSWAAGAVSGALAGFAVWMGVFGPAWLP